MKKNTTIFLLAITLTISILSAGCKSNKNRIENDKILVEFNEDLSGFVSILDKKTGRNYVSGTNSDLYQLTFGENYNVPDKVTSSMSTTRKARKIEDGLEIEFNHEGETSLKVICTIRKTSGSLLHWNIKVENKSEKILNCIEYPILSCAPLENKPGTDRGVLYPFLEGVLLTGIFDKGAQMRQYYPGQISAQLMYYFDPSGGLYYAAQDGEGNKKYIQCRNKNGNVLLSQEYHLPIKYKSEVELPYEVAIGVSEGTWESGASIYKSWSREQFWCNKTIKERDDVTAWLKEPNLLINYSYVTPPFATVDGADKIIKNYHDFFDMPIIATGFGWEKNQIWMGPDVFPPIHGDNYYKQLAEKVKARGDHLHIFSSGFRWAIKKPITLPNGKKGFTDYDGTDDFMKNGRDMAVIDKDGKMILAELAWAHNYIICPGSELAKNMMDSLYQRIFDWGVSGIDIDQNLGGEVDECFSEEHGHPKGDGLWQYETMKDFLSTERKKAKSKYPDSFLGVEECCEIFMPQLDVFHGRSYIETGWPVMGPGSMAVPLYIYLYHPYQIGYSGWIDPGFSAFGDERYGLGRSFILGMYPGVRTSDTYNQTTGFYALTEPSGKFDLTQGVISEEMKILKNYTELMKACPEFLIYGDMIKRAEIDGSDTLKPEVANRRPLTVTWMTVQGYEWLSDKEDAIGYAVANLSDKEYQNLSMKLNAEASGKVELLSYDYDSEKLNTKELIPEGDGTLNFDMKPWKLYLIKQYRK